MFSWIWSSRKARRKIQGAPLFFGKAVEQILWEAIFKHMKDMKVVWRSEHWVIKSKLWLMNLINFYNEFTAAVDKGRPVKVVHLGCFRDTSHWGCIPKFMRCGGIVGSKVGGKSAGSELWSATKFNWQSEIIGVLAGSVGRNNPKDNSHECHQIKNQENLEV